MVNPAKRLAGLFVFVMTAQASAQATRTFVSFNGSDTNDCTRQAPCRSFAAAITKTNAGGEINTLDPGGYGPVTITKSISIVSGLGEAGILVPAGGTGITISAGASDHINLRGLAIEGAGSGKAGVFFNSGGSLTISNSVIRNVTDNAIDLEPNAVTGVIITDTLIADNGRVGVYLYPQGNNARLKASISRTTVTNNQWGIYVNGNASTINTTTSEVVIVESNISYNNKGDGIGIYGNGGVTNAQTVNTRLSVVNSQFV